MSFDSQSSSNAVGGGEIMLFGVRVKVDPLRTSVSMNNLSEYDQPVSNPSNQIEKSGTGELPEKVAAPAEVGGFGGYASADDAVPRPSNVGVELKRGVPWTEEEHKLFLIGLQKAGKGDWRGISRNYVKTRTPTQVASHAQKYFLRQTNVNRRRRRSSLFDITTESVPAMPTDEGRRNHEELPPPPQPTPQPALAMHVPVTASNMNMNGFAVVSFPMIVGQVLPEMQPGGGVGWLRPLPLNFY